MSSPAEFLAELSQLVPDLPGARCRGRSELYDATVNGAFGASPDDLAALLPSWKLALRADRKSPQTVDAYTTGVPLFLAWCAQNGHAAELDRALVRGWVTDLLAGGAARAATARVTCPTSPNAGAATRPGRPGRPGHDHRRALRRPRRDRLLHARPVPTQEGGPTMNTLERDGNGIPIHPSHWVDVPDPEPEGLERALIDMFVANEFDAETATALTAEVMGVLTDGKYENSPGELAKKPDGTWVCFQTEDDHYAFDPTRWKASE